MSSFIRSTAIFLNSIIISLWIVPEDHEYVKNDTLSLIVQGTQNQIRNQW